MRHTDVLSRVPVTGNVVTGNSNCSTFGSAVTKDC